MEIIYLLIPLSILLVVVIISFFMWSVRTGQFEDLKGPAHRILLDNDDIHEPDSDVKTTGQGASEQVTNG